MSALEPIDWTLTNDPEDMYTYTAYSVVAESVEVIFDAQSLQEAIAQGRNLLGEELSRQWREEVLMYEEPTSTLIHETKSQDNRRRIDMEALPQDIKSIPDTFENVIKALVKPLPPKKPEGKK